MLSPFYLLYFTQFFQANSEISIMNNFKKKHIEKESYDSFEQINGSHSLKSAVPESYIEYNVRKKHHGKVQFFNFNLAREMGLISKDHPISLPKKLEDQILDTFSIVIINEYDIIHKTPIAKKDIKPNKYMATKYLQLQHECKKGSTSGDGRSIWNGEFENNGTVWDISSCGTGATRLSPAYSKHKKFFKTGDPSISYGCGLSELDEGIGTLFFSEVMEKNNINTERVLAIIAYPKGYAITVRVHKNLLRPSHFLLHLKQGNMDALQKLLD